MKSSILSSALLTTPSPFPGAPSSGRWARWLVFAAVFAIALAFAAFTRHTWEDYYIGSRISKNLAAGHGPVYTVGEKVQVFSSPLNVLIPAALCVMTGNSSDELVLWLFRLLSAALLAAAAALLVGIARRNSLGLMPAAVLVGVFALDSKVVDFSVNGMEAGFMMVFLAMALHALTVRSDWTILELGLSGAGLMWTRPDGFIYIGALGVGFLLFNAGELIGLSRLGLFKVLVAAAAITTVLYLPWVLWSWHYFGSPIPHTVIAKGLAKELIKGSSSTRPLQLIGYCLAFPFGMLVGRTSAGGTFLPPNALLFGGWPWAAVLFSKGLACICGLYWCVPTARPQGRAASFAFMLSHIYLSRIAAFAAAWYLPMCTLLGAFVFAQVAQHGLDLARTLGGAGESRSRFWTGFVRAVGGTALVATLALMLGTAYQMRVQQREIEQGQRTQIGLWLRQHAASTADSVFLEPLGYIGYFSQLKMLDVPGLCSPEVVAAERKLRTTSQAKLIPELRPDWLVLRAHEVDQVQTLAPRLLTDMYSSVKVFDVSGRLAAYRWLPGRNYLLYDAKFIVFKRNKPISSGQRS